MVSWSVYLRFGISMAHGGQDAEAVLVPRNGIVHAVLAGASRMLAHSRRISLWATGPPPRADGSALRAEENFILPALSGDSVLGEDRGAIK